MVVTNGFVKPPRSNSWAEIFLTGVPDPELPFDPDDIVLADDPPPVSVEWPPPPTHTANLVEENNLFYFCKAEWIISNLVVNCDSIKLNEHGKIVFTCILPHLHRNILPWHCAKLCWFLVEWHELRATNQPCFEFLFGSSIPKIN